jgi:Copper chaperone PCu(A)C
VPLCVVVGGVLLSGCTTEQPLSVPGAEVKGGAVGPDVDVTDDIGLRQVQLEYPLDGVYDVGDDARLFMAITNTGTEPARLTDISGPDFSDVRVHRSSGEGLPLVVDRNDTVYVGAEGPPDVVLEDLQRSLHSSQSIPVTFTFEGAGEVTLDVVVAAEGQSPSLP